MSGEDDLRRGDGGAEEHHAGDAVPPDPAASGHPARAGKPGAGASAPAEETPICEVCGAPMIERHCKITCTVCGYQRDCSDP